MSAALTGAAPGAAAARGPRGGLLPAAVALCLLGSGCGLFQRRAPQPPAIIVLQPPILLAPPSPAPMAPPEVLTPALDGPNAAAPDLGLALILLPPPPRRLVASDHNPERAGENAAAPPAADAAPPQLSGGVSPAQATASRQRTIIVLNQTERSLQLLNARRLNAEDTATRAQAGEYVRQARQALAQGDVVRAANLADKADTLARFLLGR
ncbi:MAG: hypothetical protein ACRD1E_12885 [Terriglobales bacterium]